ncbi:Transient receptor potential cation channel subfamily A member 1 [Paramuricea clavata]|uniref:Transient receptor potential cation channel subfamily A member 1 n=1 Tax=Paramuricea clavata TaxID=317549 RepID=A0A6S7K285_PARCT|nr:Transient receptor potential cation channel subfamily A member 1 [Paramuricea clavata]
MYQSSYKTDGQNETVFFDNCQRRCYELTVTDNKCPFRVYQSERLHCLKLNVDEFRTKVPDFENTEILDDLETVLHSISNIKKQYVTNKSKAAILESTTTLGYQCHNLCRKITSYIPTLKSRIHEFTEAGPGVGVTNHDVKYRTAEVIMLTNPDYYIRHHLSNGDSSHNEVERIQSYVGDAICDGGPLEWEHQHQEGLTNEHIEQKKLAEIEDYELKRIEYNAFKVCDDLTCRIDEAPAPDGYMKAYTSQKNEDL